MSLKKMGAAAKQAPNEKHLTENQSIAARLVRQELYRVKQGLSRYSKRVVGVAQDVEGESASLVAKKMRGG